MNISKKLLNIFHHTLSMFLHYLGKVNRLRFEKVIAKSMVASLFGTRCTVCSTESTEQH